MRAGRFTVDGDVQGVVFVPLRGADRESAHQGRGKARATGAFQNVLINLTKTFFGGYRQGSIGLIVLTVQAG